MATNYPGALDTLTDMGANLGTAGKLHSTVHGNANDAIEAIQAELGVDPAGAQATVRARLEAIEAARTLTENEVTLFEIAPDTIVPGNLAQDILWDPLHAAWTDYTATSTKANFSTGVGSFSLRYKRIGSRCHVDALMSFGAGSAITGSPTFTVPFAPYHNIVTGSVTYIIFGGNARSATCYVGQDRVCNILQPAGGVWVAGQPSSGADGDKVSISITYETATVPTGSLV